MARIRTWRRWTSRAAFTIFAASCSTLVRNFIAARLNVIRRRYLEAIQQELGGKSDGKLLLDKNPSPTAKLRIWLRLFPELRVVIALRDPRDVVISCYFQNLPLNQFNANFLSLERAATALRQFDGCLAGGAAMGRLLLD